MVTCRSQREGFSALHLTSSWNSDFGPFYTFDIQGVSYKPKKLQGKNCITNIVTLTAMTFSRVCPKLTGIIRQSSNPSTCEAISFQKSWMESQYGKRERKGPIVAIMLVKEPTLPGVKTWMGDQLGSPVRLYNSKYVIVFVLSPECLKSYKKEKIWDCSKWKY